jgi:hypothetical protein
VPILFLILVKNPDDFITEKQKPNLDNNKELDEMRLRTRAVKNRNSIPDD